MKNKIFTLTVAIIAGSLALMAQHRVTMHLLSEQEQMAAAKTLGKTVFEANKMYVYDSEGNFVTEFTSNGQLKIEVTLEEQTVTISDGESEEVVIDVTTDVEQQQIRISVAPNPASDQVFIRGAQPGSPIRVYSLNGVILKNVTATEEVTILPVDDLPAGSYLLLVDTNLVKLIKQ